MTAFGKFSKNFEFPFSTENFIKISSKESWRKLSLSVIDPQNLGYDERKEQLTNYLKTFFNFTYYLGTSPFRFVKNESTQKYGIVKWMPQQIICGILHIVSIFILIGEFRSSLPNSRSSLDRNPIPYFKLVLGGCILFHKLVAMKKFWFNQNEYLEVLNSVLTTGHLLNTKTKLTSTKLCNILFATYVFKALMSLFGGYTFVSIWDWSPSWWFKRLAAFGHFCFGFSVFPKSGEAPSLLTFGDVVLALLTFLGYFERHVLAYFCDLLVLAATLTLWAATSSMADDIQKKLKQDDRNLSEGGTMFLKSVIAVKTNADSQNSEEEEWSKMYLNFQGVRTLSEVVNNSLGSQVTWYMAVGLMYYPINLNSLLLTRDWFKRVNLVMFYALNFVILYLAGDACNRFGAIKLWLTRKDNIKKVPTHEATLVLHEMMVRDVGIQGSNVFTLTFALVATYLSLIITFFVICVQQNPFEIE